jgi:hypothetical protein
LVSLAEEMLRQSLLYGVTSTARRADGEFGPETGRVEMFAKSSWVALRGHRYQVLEGTKIKSECRRTPSEQICTGQLRGARVFKEVFYQNPATGLWVENDVLVLVDDVLVQIEAKAGAMPMHSPATSFTSHIRAVKQLVMEAYDQTKRFFEYASSAPEVPLFRRPFSAMCSAAASTCLTPGDAARSKRTVLVRKRDQIQEMPSRSGCRQRIVRQYAAGHINGCRRATCAMYLIFRCEDEQAYPDST